MPMENNVLEMIINDDIFVSEISNLRRRPFLEVPTNEMRCIIVPNLIQKYDVANG